MGVTTRQQSSLTSAAAGSSGAGRAFPETPSKSGKRDINQCFRDFNSRFNLDLPVEELISPRERDTATSSHDKLRNEVVKKVKRLFWQYPERLHEAVTELDARVPAVRYKPNRLDVIHDRLAEVCRALPTATVSGSMTVSPVRYSDNGNGSLAADEAPPSPTLAVKHAPPPTPDARANIFENEPSFAIPALPAPIPGVQQRLQQAAAQSTLAINTPKSSSPTRSSKRKTPSFEDSLQPCQLGSYPDAVSYPKLPQVTPLVPESAKTSFATTVNRSFRSEATSMTQMSNETAATSFSGSTQATQGSDSGDDTMPLTQAEIDEAKNLCLADDAKGEDYRVAGLRTNAFAVDDLPESMHSLPTFLAAEAYRVMRACKLSPADFEKSWTSRAGLKSLWEFGEGRGLKKRFKRGFETDYKDHTLFARLKWNSKPRGPLFSLELLPPQPQRSNAFERRAVGGRILVIDLPDIAKPPKSLGLGGQATLIARIREMLARDLTFLGREWAHFYIKKKKQSGLDLDADEASAYQLMFVAVRVPGLPDIDLVDFLQSFVPFAENSGQLSCKAYSRLDLAASRTHATVILEPTEIEFIPDLFSTTEAEDTTFDDPSRKFPPRPAGWNAVMTDGCGYATFALFNRVFRMMNEVRPGLMLSIPSVLQVRFCGSKGLLHCVPGDETRIWIRDSQRKLKKQDLADAEWRTLNINDWSRPPRPSYLYTGFVPILVEQGVPPQAITDIVQEVIQVESGEVKQAISRPALLHQWLFQHKNVHVSRKTSDWELQDLVGFPQNSAERVLEMLENGFSACENSYAKNQLSKEIEEVFTARKKGIKFMLPNSTALMGIPDPSGTLRPGEIFVMFSQPHENTVTKQRMSSLHGHQVLASRNPSLADGDVQRLQCVFRPELAEFYDVVIFSVQGPRPQAGKHSGGDYDGDIFWICWDERLVQPFQNAPVDYEPLPPETFGITKDGVTLGEIVPVFLGTKPREAQIRRWLQKGVADRMTESLLPIVTLYHTKLAYKLGSLRPESVRLLAQLHDHLVDADKQGYRYTKAAFEEWKRSQDLLVSPDDPAYWWFTRAKKSKKRKDGRPDEDGGDGKATPTPKPGDCLDDVFFGCVAPEYERARNMAHAAMRDTRVVDPDLVKLSDALHSDRHPQIQKELAALDQRLKVLLRSCNAGLSEYMKDDEKTAPDFSAMVQQCWLEYQSIQPVEPEHEIAVEWLRRFGKSMTMWEQIRASRFMKLHLPSDRRSGGVMLYSIAGADLCRMKAQFFDRPRTMDVSMYMSMKPMKRGDVIDTDFDDDGGLNEEDSDLGETFYEGASAVAEIHFPEAPMTPASKRRKSSPKMAKASQSENRPTTTCKGKRMQPVRPSSAGRLSSSDFVSSFGQAVAGAPYQEPGDGEACDLFGDDARDWNLQKPDWEN